MNRPGLVLILSCCALAGSIQLRAFDPLLVSIGRDLNVNVGTVVLLPAVYAMAFGFMQLLLGPISDTIGKTLVIRWCLAGLALFTVVAAFARSFDYLILWRLLAGAAAGGIVPVCFAIVSDRLPEKLRQGAINQIIAFSVTGQILAAAAAGIMTGFLGWRWVLVVWGAFIAAAAFAAAYMLGGQAAGPREAVGWRAVVAHTRAAYAYTLTHRRMRPLILICYFNAVLTVGLLPFVITTLSQTSGDQTAGYALALFAAGGLANSWLSRVTGGRLSKPGYLVAGVCVSCIGTFGAATLPVWFFVLLPGLIGIGFYMTQSTLAMMFGSVGEGYSGTSLSLFMFTFFLGQATGPIVWSLIQARLGDAAVSIFVAIGLTLLALISWSSLSGQNVSGGPNAR